MPRTYLLTIEKSSDNNIWGRVTYDDDLLVDSAKTIWRLEQKFKKLLHDFHDADPAKTRFEIAYDLSSLFQNKNFLNISAIAKKAGINASLMRQYAAGIKSPSDETAKKIEGVIRDLGKELLSVRIGTRIKEPKNKKLPGRNREAV